jgi:hypothetical protein
MIDGMTRQTASTVAPTFVTSAVGAVLIVIVPTSADPMVCVAGRAVIGPDEVDAHAATLNDSISVNMIFESAGNRRITDSKRKGESRPAKSIVASKSA